jgi:hypothetical protein
VKLPWWIPALGAALFVAVGFGWGYHVRGNVINAATVKQVQKVAKIDARNAIETENQNDADNIRVTELERQLADARAAAAARGVPARPRRCLPGPEANAGPDPGASAADESARRYEAAYRALRDDLIVTAAVAERMRLQVLSCHAQWPE